MSKNDRDWLLWTPPHDVNFKQHLKSASLRDLKRVLVGYSRMLHKKTAKEAVEAEIRRRFKKWKGEKNDKR